MTTDIPQWALDEADKLAAAEPTYSVTQCARDYRHGFARYIAAHEEAPEDPLLIEARKIGEEYCPTVTGRYINGELDDHGSTKALLAALKRGMELARDPS